MTTHPLKPGITWAAMSILVLLITPFIIITLPSATTLLLAILLLLTALFLFFKAITSQLIANLRRERKQLFKPVLLLVGFLLIFSNELTIVREHLLFGYKAVNNQLQPALLDGDHYLADKLLFRHNPLQQGEFYVIRTPSHNAIAGRLNRLPGETLINGSDTITLGSEEYGFDLGGGEVLEIVRSEKILARAIVIYGSFDPLGESIRWERTGMPIN
jgi:hypothetical protein